MTETTKNKPIHSIRYGNVRAAIWKNENGFHSVTFERSYQKDDQWKSSDSYGRDDLPKLTAAAEDAFRWIFNQPASQQGASND